MVVLILILTVALIVGIVCVVSGKNANMAIIALILVATGVVGVLCIVLKWSINIGLIASGISIASWVIFYSVLLIVGKSIRNGILKIMLGELVTSIIAIVVASLVCKYDFAHAFTLVSPCLYLASLGGNRMIAEDYVNEKGRAE